MHILAFSTFHTSELKSPAGPEFFCLAQISASVIWGENMKSGREKGENVKETGRKGKEKEKRGRKG
jgi:hypothetical protein